MCGKFHYKKHIFPIFLLNLFVAIGTCNFVFQFSLKPNTVEDRFPPAVIDAPFFLEFGSYRCWMLCMQHATIFRFILEMTPFSRVPEPLFALIRAKRQGYSWLLGHIFIHFTLHILLSFVFASIWFNLLAHSQVWHEKFVFSHLFFILFYFSTPYSGINFQYLCNLLSFQY
jgi:hypothetical protein